MTLYLSKWRLDRRRFSNPYKIHQVLWQAFPEQSPKGEERPFLFRVNWQDTDRYLNLLMQSRLPPQAFELPGCFMQEEFKSFALQVHADQILRFLLYANPVKRLNHSRSRAPVFGPVNQFEWLARQLAGKARINQSEVYMNGQYPLHFTKAQHTGKILIVPFSGILHVEDAQAFLALMSKGVGHGKCFGCGLLSLAAPF